jgi:hypothetical protein
VNPIPENASPDDPLWAIAFLNLAHGLVMAGAKGKIIERFTGLTHRKVRELYQALRGESPPAGPLIQGSPRYFAVPSRYTSAGWSVQCAIFLECYDRMGKITEVPVQRGWRLLAAFNAYLVLTERLSQNVQHIKRLDVNQAYVLLTHCGFLALPRGADLQRRTCIQCSIIYPVVAGEELDSQGCPVCTMDTNLKRLSAEKKPAIPSRAQTAAKNGC